MLGAAGVYISGLHQYLSLETLRLQRANLQDFVADHPAASLGVYMTAYVVAVVLSLPGSLFLSLTGGFLFGMWLGAAATWFAATVGATAIFLAARTAFASALKARAGGFIAKLERGFRRNAFSYLLSLRLMPAAPFFIVNLVPAFLNVRARDFVAATALGIIPGTLVYASIGAGLGAVFDAGQTPSLSLIARPEILVGLIGLASLSLAPVFFRKRTAERQDG
jgi:uncharacterized membrane protein YdjX (TVP38/TMEM64 family)